MVDATMRNFVDRHDIHPGNGTPEQIDAEAIDQSFIDDFRAAALQDASPDTDAFILIPSNPWFLAPLHVAARSVSKHMNLAATARFVDRLYSHCPEASDSVLCRERPQSLLPATPVIRTAYAGRVRAEIAFISDFDPAAGKTLRVMFEKGKIKVANWNYPAPALVDPREPETIVLMQRLFTSDADGYPEKDSQSNDLSPGSQMHGSSWGITRVQRSREAGSGKDTTLAETLVHEYRHIRQFDPTDPSNASPIDAEHTIYCGVSYEDYSFVAEQFQKMPVLDRFLIPYLPELLNLSTYSLRPKKYFHEAILCANANVTQNYPDLDPKAPERFRGYYFDLTVFRDLSARMLVGISALDGKAPPAVGGMTEQAVKEAAVKEGLHQLYQNAFEQTEAEAVASGGIFVMAVEENERRQKIDALLATIGIASYFMPLLIAPDDVGK